MGLGAGSSRSSTRSSCPGTSRPPCEQVAEAIRDANRAILAEASKREQADGLDHRRPARPGRALRDPLGRRQPRLSAARRRVQPAEPRPYPGPGDGRPRHHEPEDAVGHPMGHILSRAVGVRERGRGRPGRPARSCPATSSCSAATACTAMSTSGEIARLLARGSPERALDELVDADARQRRARQCHR